MVDLSKVQWVNMQKIITCFILSCFFGLYANAQSRPSTYSGTTGSNTDNQNEIAPDTSLGPFIYKYYHALFPNDQKIQVDTSLNNYFNDIEVAKKAPFNKLNTGNNGSSFISPLFDTKTYSGFHTGYHQYDGYNYTLDSIKFYNSKRTFSDLFFSQILGNQSNFEVGAIFGQKFKGGAQLSVNYRRVLQIGFYKDQGTKTTNFSTALAFYGFKRKMKFTPGFIINNNNEMHNGGIDSTGIGNQLSQSIYLLRTNVPTRLTGASTRYTSTSVFLISEYGLKSIGQDSFQSSIGHKIVYTKGTNRFSDIGITESIDSAFYASLNYAIDDRGLRNYATIKQFSNEFFITGTFKWASGRLSLTHDSYAFDNQIKNTANDLTVKFKGNVNIGRTFLLNTEASLGLGSNVGTFSLKGNTDIKFTKSIILNANAELFRSQASANDEQFFINEQVVFSNNFNAPFGSKVKATLNLKGINTAISVGQNLVNNYIYRNTLDRPTQDATLLSSTFISLYNKIRLWKINLESNAYAQTINKNYIPVPNQYVKASLYFEGLLFRRVMLLRFGGEYRYIPKFNLPSFDPVQGNFYKSQADIETTYSGLDLFLSAKVSKFRIFVKYENFFNLIKNNITYLTENHPLFDANVRFGIRWILVD